MPLLRRRGAAGAAESRVSGSWAPNTTSPWAAIMASRRAPFRQLGEETQKTPTDPAAFCGARRAGRESCACYFSIFDSNGNVLRPLFRLCHTASARITCSGSFLIARSSARAGPVGSRRPCSQLRSVPTSTSRILAKFGCDRPVTARTFLISTALDLYRVDVGLARRSTLAADGLARLFHALKEFGKKVLVHGQPSPSR